MKRYFLVDSENVNDNWLMLFDIAEEDDEIIVFYTSKSPHMSYQSVIRLITEGRHIIFEECYEGNNGLDFQLVSYLGYIMKENEGTDTEFYVMSNDTGFDAPVAFWKKKGVNVKRINVNYCKLFVSRKKTVENKLKDFKDTDATESLDEEAEVCNELSSAEAENLESLAEPEISETADITFKEVITEKGPYTSDPEILSDACCEAMPVPETIPVSKVQPVTEEPVEPVEKIDTEVQQEETINNFEPPVSQIINKEELGSLVLCIGKSKLAEIHNVLQLIYPENTSDAYKVVKDKAFLKSLPAKKLKKKEKYKIYAETVFGHSESEKALPEDISDFLISNEDKLTNLNAIRPAFIKKYGKALGNELYTVYKPHFKFLAEMK